MKKYEVTIQFFWKADVRGLVWVEVEQYIRQNMRDLAWVKAVSLEPDPKPAEIIALNEPIKPAEYLKGLKG